ncbi:MAG TPA: preprotein translocase subunit YajC [Cytophagaceae bacterium]|jgi:preprotein translocase subunit YajC|nr:preprotein translocase subunit YajC [Cytophagaceae bacterium]
MLEFVLLQASKDGGNQYVTYLFMGGAFAVMYFFMIRPQQKKAKEAKLFKEGMKKGDNIVTIGGLHGKIASIENDDTIIIEVDKGIKLTFEKSSVSAEATKKVQAVAEVK